MPWRWAGVAELPFNPAAAQTKAQQWATNNGVDSSQIKKIEVRTTGVPNGTLYVELEGDFSWIFGRVLGQTTDKVGAKAAAPLARSSVVTMPWALLLGDTNCLDGTTGKAIFGATCQVKVGAQDGVGGWRGALDYDGNGGGSNEYRDNIIDGTVDWLYCIQGDPEPACAGSHTIVDALTGNKVGPTGQGIDTRWATGAQCDTKTVNGKDDFNEVFTPTGHVSPAYTVSCPDSPWLIIIPIITYESTPIHTVTIRGWTLAYLSSYACFGGNNCAGGKGHWEVSIEIADAAYSQSAGFLGNFDPTSGILIRRLIE